MIPCETDCTHRECKELYLTYHSQYVKTHPNTVYGNKGYICANCSNMRARRDEKYIFGHSKAHFSLKTLIISTFEKNINLIPVGRLNPLNNIEIGKYFEILKYLYSCDVDKYIIISDFSLFMSHCISNETIEVQTRHIAWNILSEISRQSTIIDVRKICELLTQGYQDITTWYSPDPGNSHPGTFVEFLLEGNPTEAVKSAIKMNRWDLAMGLSTSLGLESVIPQFCQKVAQENEFFALFLSYLSNNVVSSPGTSDWQLHVAALLTILPYNRDLSVHSIINILTMLIDRNLIYGSLVCLLVLFACARVPLTDLMPKFMPFTRTGLSGEILMLLLLLDILSGENVENVMELKTQFVSLLGSCELFQDAAELAESVLLANLDKKIPPFVVFQLYDIYMTVAEFVEKSCNFYRIYDYMLKVFTALRCKDEEHKLEEGEFVKTDDASFDANTENVTVLTEPIQNVCGDIAEPNFVPKILPDGGCSLPRGLLQPPQQPRVNPLPSIPPKTLPAVKTTEISPPTAPLPIKMLFNGNSNDDPPKETKSVTNDPPFSTKPGERKDTFFKSALNMISSAFRRSNKGSMYWDESSQRWIDPNESEDGGNDIPLPPTLGLRHSSGMDRPVVRRDDCKLHYDVLADKHV